MLRASQLSCQMTSAHKSARLAGLIVAAVLVRWFAVRVHGQLWGLEI
jgi:hypothetical protein